MLRLLPAVSVAAALCTGCIGPSSVPATVTVQSPHKQPIAGATVAWVCTPSGDAGSVSGDDGAARAVLYNSDPKDCVITVAKLGYRTAQQAVTGLAPLTVVLEASAP